MADVSRTNRHIAIKYIATKVTDPKAALVLLSFLAKVDKRNMVKGTPVELAKNLEITSRNFALGIRELKKVGLVRKYSKQEYMLHPYVFPDANDLRLIKYLWNTQTTRGLRDDTGR